MSDLDSLVPWLHEQLDTDERHATEAARVAGGATWVVLPNGHGVEASGPAAAAYLTGSQGELESELAQHVADHDPTAALRSVATGRAMLTMHEQAAAIRNEYTGRTDAEARFVLDRVAGELGVLNELLEHLAVEYANRPGYEEAWRP